MGKRHLAQYFAQSLLCKTPDAHGTPCHTCRSCQLWNAGSHPDHHLVALEKDRKVIRIDQIREAIAFQVLTGQYSATRVVIIAQAELMNTNASNALLKTLEEPGEGVQIILCSDQPMTLLATIRSRCQSITFKLADQYPAAQWLREHIADPGAAISLLAMSGNAPLVALQLAEKGVLQHATDALQHFLSLRNGKGSVSALATEWLKGGVGQSLDWLYIWLSTMVRIRYSSSEPHADNTLDRELQRSAEQVDLSVLFALLDQVTEAKRYLERKFNLNEALVLENILSYWQQAR